MVESTKWIKNTRARDEKNKVSLDYFNLEKIEYVKKFHESFMAYSKTPLTRLKNLSNKLGVAEIIVKDESYRFGLNAFKVLGSSYAIGKLLSEKLDIPISELTFDILKSEEVKKKLGEIVFITATDGNHGRGLAWTAEQLGHQSVVYMPKGSSNTRLENIRKEGAKASITDLNYDDAVRLAKAEADKYGYEIIQDTAWEGYDDIPLWIMQGYSTLMLEAVEQLEEIKLQKPTHVFIQAGVGSLAGGIQGFLSAYYGQDRPITAIVEPNKADCIYRSKLNEKITSVTGDMDTIMAGLACGEPNPIGWEILNSYSDMFISCPEYISANGMRILGNPLTGDEKVISGESGSVTLGMVYEILNDPKLKDLKEELKLDKDSRIMVINTEGDTDPDNYRKIVWEGAFPKND